MRRECSMGLPHFEHVITLLFLLLGRLSIACAQVTVTVDSDSSYQTWEGWQVTIPDIHHDDPSYGDEHPIPQSILDAHISDAVDSLGLTALRHDILLMASRNRAFFEPGNDNNDPFVLDASKFEWRFIDAYARSIVVPFKKRVEARGSKFVLVLQAIAWNAWHWDLPASDPGQEYAEAMMAVLNRYRNEFGIVADYVAVYNEPDNSSATESKDEVIRGMKALAARMDAAGYTDTILRFPEVSFPGNAVSWFDRLVATEPGLVSRTEMSFHGYSDGFGGKTGTLNSIRSRARQFGLKTSQTEWWFTDDHPPDIFLCLTEADVVYYEPYALGTYPRENNSSGIYTATFTGSSPNYNYTGFARSADWYDIYHYSAFIRPGDVRIAASSSSRGIQPVAFENQQGRHCVVVHNDSSTAVDIEIEGVNPGTYDVVLTDDSHQGSFLPQQTVQSGEKLTLRLADGGLATFVEKEGAGSSSSSSSTAVSETYSLRSPARVRLERNYPNPFNSQTWIPFEAPAAAGEVRLDIYNVLGQPIRTLVDGTFRSGRHVVPWDGRNDRDEEVSSGVYVYRLRVGEQSAAGKIVKGE